MLVDLKQLVKDMLRVRQCPESFYPDLVLATGRAL